MCVRFTKLYNDYFGHPNQFIPGGPTVLSHQFWVTFEIAFELHADILLISIQFVVRTVEIVFMATF